MQEFLFFIGNPDILYTMSLENVELVSCIRISWEKVEPDVSPPSWFKGMEIIQARPKLMRIEFNNLKEEKKEYTTTYNEDLFGKVE